MMQRTYFITSFVPLPEEGKKYLDSLQLPYRLIEKSERSWIISCDSSLGDKILKYPRFFFEAFGKRSNLMIAHNDGPLARYLGEESLSFFVGEICYLSEVILKNASYGKYEFVPLLSNEFKKLDETLLMTIHEYLLSERRADIASDHLYIHRNTFLYRLKKIREKANIDLNSYHDCLLFELFFQFTHHSLPRYN